MSGDETKQKKGIANSSLCYTVGPHCSSFFNLLLVALVFFAGCGLSLVLESRGYFPVAVHRLLTVASFIVEHGL